MKRAKHNACKKENREKVGRTAGAVIIQIGLIL